MIRALVTFDPSALPSLKVMQDAPIEEQAEHGILPGVDAVDWLLLEPFDPRGIKATVEGASWIRETPAGIEMRRHPEAALRDDPMLWRTMTQWNAGLWRQPLTLAEYGSLSNFEVELLLAAQPAFERERKRDDLRNRKPTPGSEAEA